MGYGDQGQVTEGAPRAALRSCSVATPTTIVRPCTDLFNWMAGWGAGAGPLPSDHLGLTSPIGTGRADAPPP